MKMSVLQSQTDELKKTYRLAVFIGIAMIGSIFVYAGLVEAIRVGYIPWKSPILTPDKAKILKYILLGIPLMEFFLIKFIRQAILQEKQETKLEKPSALFQRLVSASIITYALCEAVAILGLVLFILTGNYLDFYIFLVISLIYIAIYFPRYSHWEEWIKNVSEKQSSDL